MMTNEKSQKALFNAVVTLLRPLVRILLRNGVPYGAFTDLVKRAYIDVAMKEFQVPGRKQSKSRVATITGLSRKEIQRILTLPKEQKNRDGVACYNRAARVVFGWVHDKKYATAIADTAELPFEGASPSFSGLVKEYSGDVPPRAILDELLQVGVVSRNDKGVIKLLERAYIPTIGEAEKLLLLGRDVAGLLSSMDRNIHEREKPPRFQHKVFYDNLSEEAAEELQVLLEGKGQALLAQLDQWMAEHDRDVNPSAGGTGQKAAGIGIYYFEEDIPTTK